MWKEEPWALEMASHSPVSLIRCPHGLLLSFILSC